MYRYKAYTRKDIDSIPQLGALPERLRRRMKVVARILPFRVNNYVVENLIDWSAIPDDPIYQLTIPQPEMLEPADFERVYDLMARDAPEAEIEEAAREIQRSLNPHPAGQLELNVPVFQDQVLEGMQHKYRETVLFVPAAGQTCHAYCTYCFRWAQFVGLEELKFAGHQADNLAAYVASRPEVTSVLITGGDPLVMKTSVLRRYIEPLLAPELDHMDSIRIGTKAVAYWPYRFTEGPDADDLLRLFEQVREAGKHLALMGHYSHPRELQPPIAREAMKRIQCTGAVIRTQAPLIRHVNDSAETWGALWREQVRLGAVPYYMFVERNTGPQHYFEVPLGRAVEIYREAYRVVSGLGRTARGPSMSATAGKVLINGIVTIRGERVFALEFLQARDPEWVGRPFFARYDPEATWFNQLEPAFGETEFFFEPGLREIRTQATSIIPF